MTIFKKEPKEQEKLYSIALIFSDGHREYHDFSSIQILENCLIVIDPIDEIPCEVHCIPFTSLQSFIFDVDAIKDKKTNLKLEEIADIFNKKKEEKDGKQS